MKNFTPLSSLKNGTTLFLSCMFLLTAFAFSTTLKTTPTVSVSADKMNLFYIGIDNPITVAMAGIPAEKVSVSCDEAEIENLGNGHFNVRVNTVGKKIIKVEADGIAPKEIEYRVKRIPDPQAMVNFSSGGAVPLYRFKQQKRIRADLYGWPLEDQCEIKDFEFTYQPKGGAPINVVNIGAEFNEEILAIIEKMEADDLVYFDHIKSLCPGDPAARKINAMVFKMK